MDWMYVSYIVVYSMKSYHISYIVTSLLKLCGILYVLGSRLAYVLFLIK
jgi:hypothetical protein